ncbi:MAG: sugar phosphate nucleotidyltransferase [Tepidiformaceae bacterium]
MDAIVLVGGQGTRLRPLTAHRHKSLVPVCNVPAIEHLFRWIEASGCGRIVLAIGQDNDDLARAYPPVRRGRVEFVHVMERERLESGGAIRNAVRSAGVEGRFVVLNGDVFVDFDFGDALRAHEAAGADLTLALTPVEDPSQFGVAVLDDREIVEGFVEKPPPGTAPSKLVNAGVWIFEPGLVGEIPPGAVRVEETLFPSLVARRRAVLGYTFAGPWADIGTPARYLDLNLRLLAGGHAEGDRPGFEGSLRGDGVVLWDGATIVRSVLGRETTVGPNAVVEDSVTWEDVEIGAGAQIRKSVIADGVSIGAGAEVEGAVIGRGARVEPGARLTVGSSVDAGASVS